MSSRWAATGKQQQVSSSKQQQVAGKQQGSSRQAAAGKSGQAAGKQQASSRQAAGKQQPAFAPLKEWSNIFLKNQRNKKKWTFSRRTAPKRRNRSITKSCGDAKIELFPGARPPDTTFTSWYDLTLALVLSPGTHPLFHTISQSKNTPQNQDGCWEWPSPSDLALESRRHKTRPQSTHKFPPWHQRRTTSSTPFGRTCPPRKVQGWWRICWPHLLGNYLGGFTWLPGKKEKPKSTRNIWNLDWIKIRFLIFAGWIHQCLVLKYFHGKTPCGRYI